MMHYQQLQALQDKILANLPKAYWPDNLFKPLLKHYENFPVASILLPKNKRIVVKQLYLFARMMDDFADEGTLDKQNRLNYLTAFEQLITLLQNTIHQQINQSSKDLNVLNSLNLNIELSQYCPALQNPQFIQDFCQATRLTIEATPLNFDYLKQSLLVFILNTMQLCYQHTIDIMQLQLLLTAFIQDVNFKLPQNGQAIEHYCALSANPVGHMLLQLFKVIPSNYSVNHPINTFNGSLNKHTQPQIKQTIQLSNQLCTALQRLNFYQDIVKDAHKHRLYLPAQHLLAYQLPIEPSFYAHDLTANSNSAKALQNYLSHELQALMHQFNQAQALINLVKPHSKRLAFELACIIASAQKACSLRLAQCCNHHFFNTQKTINIQLKHAPAILLKALRLYI